MFNTKQIRIYAFACVKKSPSVDKAGGFALQS